MLVHYLGLLLSLPLFCAASSVSVHEHSHRSNKPLPGTWYHAPDHPAHKLFRRGTDGNDYPEVGSPTWSSAYPSSTPDTAKLPQAWVDALNAAVAAGKIPDIPVSTNLPNQNPTYPSGYDPTGPVVCSATYKCRNANDTWDAPEGHLGLGFDDGPQDASDILMDFLKANGEITTHFMIGVNIIGWSKQFQTAVNNGDDIACHTWTHPYMTTLTNLELVGQFGWTMELIHNSTGGRLPKYWRPPYGDSDNRVRAVAEAVFGLHTIIWNQDTEDWSLTTGGTTAAAINASMTTWLTGPKSPGLIILEHELSNQSVAAFMAAYPVIKSNGWITKSVAELADPDGTAWQNAASSNSTVTPVGIILGTSSPVATSSSSSTTASASGASSPSSSITNSASGSTTSSSTSASSSSSSQQSNGAYRHSSIISCNTIESSWALVALLIATSIVL